MSQLSIDDKLMTQLFESGMARNSNDPLREKYSHLVFDLFNRFLSQEGRMQDNILVYDLNRENWKAFVKDFSRNNARLKGQSGSPGVLKQRVSTRLTKHSI